MTRPQTRGDCLTGPRPCPYAGCRHHLAHHVLPRGERGADRLLRRLDVVEARVLDMIETNAESCSIDVADRGEHTHEEIAALIGATSRKGSHHIEETAIRHAQRRMLGWAQ